MPEHESARVAAVVVTYNRCHLLPAVLDGLLAQVRPPDAVFVMDNASTDGTDRLIVERYARRVNYVWLEANSGGAGGFHEGMKRAADAGYDWIWIMDDDVVPLPECLQQLLRHAHHQDILIPLRIAPSGKVVERAALKFDLHSFFCWNPRLQSVAEAAHGIPESALPDLLPVLDCSFEGPLIPRSLIANIGLPRKDFFLYVDDAEYAWRARQQARARIWCVTRARMVRLLEEAPSLASPEPWRLYYYWRNMFWLYRTYAQTWRARFRPFPVWVARTLYSAARLRLDEVRVLAEAYADSRGRELPRRYVPGKAAFRRPQAEHCRG